MATGPQAVSAPMCRIFVNGNIEIGWGTGINATESTQNVPIHVLGSAFVQQFCPVAVGAQCSISSVHIDKETLEDLGLYPQGSTKDVVTFEPLMFELVNTLDDPTPIARVHGCMPAGRGLPLGRGGVIARDVRYDAIRLEVIKQK